MDDLERTHPDLDSFPAQSNYPELDVDQVPRFAWSGQGPQPSHEAHNTSGDLRYSLQELPVPQGFTSFHQHNINGSSQLQRSDSLKPSRIAWPEQQVPTGSAPISPSLERSNNGNGWEAQENLNV